MEKKNRKGKAENTKNTELELLFLPFLSIALTEKSKMYLKLNLNKRQISISIFTSERKKGNPISFIENFINNQASAD